MASQEIEVEVELPNGASVPAGILLPAEHRAGRTPVVILAHGAGTGRRHAALVAMQEGLAARGYAAVTFDFPYRAAGRRIPDRPPVLESCWRAVLAAVQAEPRLAPPWVAIGGRSMGGRIASHVAADGATVRGLVFLAFPLHPAGRPGVVRAAHLARITAPMLFVQGTRDALADRALLDGVLDGLPRAQAHWIEGGDHTFRVPRRSGHTPADVTHEVLDVVAEWLDKLSA